MSTGPIEWELDLDALGHNLRCVTDRLPASVRVIASVKANAYGHGVLAIGGALDELGVHGLATASPADALALRDARVRCELLLFGGQPPGELPDLARRGITVTITNSESCAALADAEPGLPAYFKVDCGLGRLGVSVDEAEAFVHERLLPSGISLKGIYTHLPFHGPAGERRAREGLTRFEELVGRLRDRGVAPPLVQALSSPGIASGLPLSGDAVCPGRLLYGLAPAVGDAASWGLRPVLRSLSTPLVHVRRHTADGPIGGGASHAIHAGDTTAVIGFGRSSGNLADTGAAPAVLHRGRRVPVVSVSLEHATLDLGQHPASVGDRVLVLGEDGSAAVTLEELGEWSHLDALDALVALDRGSAR